MEQLDKCQYEYPFSLLYPFEKHVKMVDCGTLQDSNGLYYFLSKHYLTKLCSLLKIPVSFLKTFFTVDRNGALTYFSKLDFSKIKFYANQNDMIIVSKNEVYDVYCVLMNQLFTQPFDFWTTVYGFQQDNIVSNDSFLFTRNDAGFVVKISLLEEKVYFYPLLKDGDKLYFVLDKTIEFYNPFFSSVLSEFAAIDNFEPLSYFDIYDRITDIPLSFSELLAVLRSLKVIKGDKRIKVLDEETYFSIFTDDMLLSFVHNSTSRERLTTASPYKVGDTIKLLSAFLSTKKDISIDDIYWCYKKFLEEDLDLKK